MSNPASVQAQIEQLKVQAMASNARIEGYKAGNAHAQANGHREPPFPFSAFREEAGRLDEIAKAIRIAAEFLT